MTAYPDYLDFDLELTPDAAAVDGYVVRVLSSPKGEAEAQVVLPFDDDRLENVILKLGRTRSGVRKLGSPQQNLARTFGTQLYDSVFAGEVGTCFRRSLDEADRQGKGLRLRLRLSEAPALSNVPWEYLFPKGVGHFLVLSAQTPLVRYIDLPREVSPLEIVPPLHVLLVVSAPSDLAVLDTAREVANLRSAFGSLSERGLVSLDVLEKPTLSALRKALRSSEYHVLHFIGHGGYDDANTDGVLAFEDENGHSHKVSGGDLGTMLHDHRTLRLAVLNACEGARTSPEDPFSGVAQSLVLQGLPAVVAMQFEITDEAAISLAQEFYSALSDGYPVDAALAEGRKAVFGNDNDVEWGTPVLYLRAKDGRIFDVAATGSTPPAREPAPPGTTVIVPGADAATQPAAARGREPASLPAEAEGNDGTGVGAGAALAARSPTTETVDPEPGSVDSGSVESVAGETVSEPALDETLVGTGPPGDPDPEVTPSGGRGRLAIVAALVALLLLGLGLWRVMSNRGGSNAEPSASPTSSVGPSETPTATESGVPQDPTVALRIPQGTPRIDGQTNDWANAPVVTASFPVGTHNVVPPQIGAQFRLQWDEDALYFYVVVQDPVITQQHEDNLDDLWEGDAISIDLGPDAGGMDPAEDLSRAEDGQYSYGPSENGHTVLTAARTGPLLDLQGPIPGAKRFMRSTPGGYVIEAALPWSSTGVGSVSMAQVLSLVLNVADAAPSGPREGKTQAFLSSTNRSSSHPGGWKRVQLVTSVG